jgi:hypothetical protein
MIPSAIATGGGCACHPGGGRALTSSRPWYAGGVRSAFTAERHNRRTDWRRHPLEKKTLLRILVLSAILPAVLSCALSHDALMQNLRKRAAFDMDCPPDQLRLTELSESAGGKVNTVGVRGCEQQAVYVRANEHTNWVLDSKKDRKR